MRLSVHAAILGTVVLCHAGRAQQADPSPEPKATTPTAAPAAATAEPEQQAETVSVPAAARLVASAAERLEWNQLDAAQKDLDDAKALNPNQQGLWGGFGALAVKRGNLTEATDLYRIEVELHPDSDFAWRSLINLRMRGDSGGAVKTAQSWIVASPQAVEPRSALVHLLWTAQQDAAALAAAKQGAADLPGPVRESNDYQLLLGEAELRGGQLAAGSERLSHLVQSDGTPLQCNDADYELARAHQQLRLTETVQRDVLKKMSETSLAWTGEEPIATLRNGSFSLTAAWDTMGFILLQQGKFAEAEGYLLAAWRNRPSADVGEHLGDVQSALHRQDEAARTYQLAAFLGHGAPGTSPSLLKKAAAAVQMHQGDLGGVAPAKYLASQRTFAVAGTPDLSGTAVYLVLFTRDRVLQTRAAPGGSTAAQDAAIRNVTLERLFPPGVSAALLQTVLLECNGKECSVRVE